MNVKTLDDKSSLALLKSDFFDTLSEASLRGFPYFKTTQNVFCFGNENNVLAVLLYRIIDDHVTEIDFIAVKPNVRGRGLARKLLKSLTGAIWLEVHENNLKALSFYKAAGFQKVGERKAYYGDSNAILMEKKP